MNTVNVPCAVQNCHNEACHVVKTKFTFYEQVQGAPNEGYRWVPRDEHIMLYVCPDHRNKWIRRGTTLTMEGAVL
jgi:hypothetical protein